MSTDRSNPSPPRAPSRLAIVLSVLAVVGLAGAWWSATRPSPEPEAPSARPVPPGVAPEGDIAATVNGQPILAAEIRDAVSLLLALGETGELVRVEDGIEQAVEPGEERALCRELAVRFIYDELARQEAERREVVVGDATIDRAIGTAQALYEDPDAVATTEAHLLTRTGLSLEAFRAEQRSQQRTDLLRKSVNTLLMAELRTEDRAEVDAWWQGLWERSDVRWSPESCDTLFP